jgi:tubulin polyglutamylase TTLL6/13
MDVLIDENMKPYILEVNSSPSFSTDSKLDKEMKRDVIKDSLVLINIDAKNKKEYNEKRLNDIRKRSL